MRRLLLALLLALTAGTATFLLYHPTTGYGFYYDDYHFVHPYSPADIVRTFHGPWDPASVELPYYRPLTVAFYALRFEWMGINSEAYHQLSLMLFAAAAMLAGWLAFRFTARPIVGVCTVFIFVAHPAMPYSLVAWITNQMHLLEILVVLAALVWWDAVRHRRFGWWSPILVLAAAAFLIKEDGLMLLPAIVVLHVVRRHLAEPELPAVPRLFLACSIVLIVALVLLRNDALAATAARARPSLAVAVHNYMDGLNRVFRLVPADRRWQLAASTFATLFPAAAILMWRRSSPSARATIVSGAMLALLFDAPFVFVTKGEQMHVVALGAVLVLAGAFAALLDAFPTRIGRYTCVLALAAGLSTMATVARDISRDFEPFGAIVLARDEIVRSWAAVPADLRDYLSRKREPGAQRVMSSNPAEALERVTFGTHGRERAGDGVAFEWMAGTEVHILIASSAQTMVVPLRHAVEVFGQPAQVRIESNGHLIDEMRLDTSSWRLSLTALRQRDTPRFTRMHHVVITVDRAWRPSEVIPGSADSRVLGLQIGAVQIR